MEFNKKVSNPMLIGSIELLKADPSPEHNQIFINEMMKASFLAPVLITPAPEEDDEGKIKIDERHKIQFPMLTTADGRHFFMAYTDKKELEKGRQKLEGPEGGFFEAIVRMEEFMGMTLRPGSNSEGCVINPFGANIAIPKEMMVSLAAAAGGKNRK